LIAPVDLPTVLEIENDPADNASAAKCGDGRIEMKGAMSAISASEGVGNGAIEWLRTFGAKRWDNPADFCFAVLAKKFVGPHAGRANGAGRRIKERSNPSQKIRCCDRGHISTSRALSATSSTRLRAGQFRPAGSSPAMVMRPLRAVRFC